MRHVRLVLLWFVFTAITASAQGVTTATIYGTIRSQQDEALAGATVVARHEPSGTVYGATTRNNGQYTIPGLRVGGPYTIRVSLVGYQKQERSGIYLQLSQSLRQDFALTPLDVQAKDVLVVAEQNALLNASRTGAATSIDQRTTITLPTITRRIEDITRLTPQMGAGMSFAGQDNRLNNITVDGAYFNNSFGLAGQPGDRTGVAPISLDAIEQIQINIAPYDVRQGNFVGAGVNTVTRSGTNEWIGSLYYFFRNQDFVGTKAQDATINPGTFRYSMVGARLSGPIMRNKWFLFANFETEGLTQPGTTFRANRGEPVGGTITRVRASSLDSLSVFLRDRFGYDTGPYEGYDFSTPALRFLLRTDFNLDEQNKISLRYVHLDSRTDVLLSNSSSLGFGNRRTNLEALNFANSNYAILENIRSIVGEWNSIVTDNMSNQLIVGYSYHDESREQPKTLFPFVDILDNSTTYTSFGTEPFTPNNELRYWSLQLQNNLTYYAGPHTLTFGVSIERYQSENVFFPGSQSVYVYNSIQDFYTDALDYLANPNRTSSPVTLRRFQIRWTNIPGLDKPIQPLKVWYAGIYAQDEWNVLPMLRLTAGLRIDVPFFENTAYHNSQVDTLTFRNENGSSVQYRTDKMPDPNLLLSPRLGFNWDVFGDQTTILRGGTGLFTGRPAYVWISNQIGNNGVLTGFEQLDNTTARPFHPDPNHYKPTDVTGRPARSYELALTDPTFRFPQLWRSTLGFDQQLPFGFVGTVEFLYARDVNGIYYINANLKPADTVFAGPDNRPRWTSGNRINSMVTSAVVLKNQNVGYSWNIAFSLERPWQNNWYFKAGYSYGIAKNTVDPGSIAFGSWNNNPHIGDPNNPRLGFSLNSLGHRAFATASYRLEYFDIGATTLSIFLDGRTNGNASYVFAGDLNGDGGTSNDLIYIPRDKSEMNFQDYSVTVNGQSVMFTAAQQADAWEAFIQQDPYLSKNRGKYAERGALFFPMVWRADLSITQEIAGNLFGNRQGLQIRLDILNFTNLLSKDWGVGQIPVTTQPLIARGADSQGRPVYRLRNIGDKLIDRTFQQSATISDVYRLQLSIRYTFN
ncbi:MAG: carboxypeptidase regulatory-like domain-containing protein [Chlorobi bacterium]|nr:carboxypeptidase regulatory-like domain-containing protein [Chlorobiota bacterium]